MASLDRSLRRDLENKIKQARRAAETGARKALEQLAVHHHEPWSGMPHEQRPLRVRLRAHGRQLGDQRDRQRGTQTITRLVGECAYEHWHRMLFARFLAENDLLIEPEHGVAISLSDCRELASVKGVDWLELASSFAVRMLPQIFCPDDPVLEVTLPPETRSELEDLLEKLSRETFLADDSLGWVYQFWQAEQKEIVNSSGNKIGADELPAVTQLFTEDYMVEFLLHNTLGAWWAGKVLAANPELAKSAKEEDELRTACALGEVRWTYLRFVREEDNGPWRPAAGTFEGWPGTAKDITVLDPCMGSGHFLVFALPIMAALRMEEEGLSEEAAIEAALRDNLFGLEIDQRCTQIAAFNLALAAWRRVGYCPLPPLHLACSGLAIGVSKAEWLKLAERGAAPTSERIKNGLESLYDLFAKAPWLGSLIDPHRTGGDLFEAGFKELEPLLTSILANGQDAELTEIAVTAHGMAKAAKILTDKFILVATNVPYLGRGKQEQVLMEHCERFFPQSAENLGTVFLERCRSFSCDGGTAAVVTPENWLYLGIYKELRKALLVSSRWNFVAKLGTKSFQTPMWDFNVLLISINRQKINCSYKFADLNVGAVHETEKKIAALIRTKPVFIPQLAQLQNPDARVVDVEIDVNALLDRHAEAFKGLSSGDSRRFIQFFWERASLCNPWVPYQGRAKETTFYDGREQVLFWENGSGVMASSPSCYVKGAKAWGSQGFSVNQISLAVNIYTGEMFDENAAVVVPRNRHDFLSIWTFLESNTYKDLVRSIDKAFKVTNRTLVKVPFALAHWQKVATEKYPNGLPIPHSDDPTQWLFNGHPKGSEQPLQVAVARLLGYRWPRQTGSSFPDCPALGPDGLEPHADEDGIVCLPPLNREQPAAHRLRALLAEAFGQQWSAAKERELLAATDSKSETLEDWLLDEFFEQHSALFHHRPFVWHIWDGRRDGFNALVNYHKLAAPNGEGRRLLEKLIYSSLGDWITQQKQEQQAGKEGADARVAAAKHLQQELIKILEGEPPFDIFVRWKPLHEQAIGWDPDINDGVRLNIRPFITARPLGARARNACIFRSTPRNIKWTKDRGKEPKRPKEDYPWFWSREENGRDFTGGKEFDGARWNDLHYSNEFKKDARNSRERIER